MTHEGERIPLRVDEDDPAGSRDTSPGEIARCPVSGWVGHHVAYSARAEPPYHGRTAVNQAARYLCQCRSPGAALIHNVCPGCRVVLCRRLFRNLQQHRRPLDRHRLVQRRMFRAAGAIEHFHGHFAHARAGCPAPHREAAHVITSDPHAAVTGGAHVGAAHVTAALRGGPRPPRCARWRRCAAPSISCARSNRSLPASTPR